MSFWYKVQGREDVTKAFIVTKLLEGAKRGAGTQDNRVPITLNILTKLVQALDKICVLVLKSVSSEQLFVWHFLDFCA